MSASLHSRLRRERDEAVQAAVAAAALIRSRAGLLAEAEVSDKGTHDLVTQVDLESQELIVGRLRRVFPDYAFLAEEGAPEAAEENADGFRWIIDPIDGTTNFTRGTPPYAVSIGLQRESELVLGVVLDAPHDALYTAIAGDGLYVNGRPAQVRGASTLGRSLLTTGFPYRAFGHADAYLEALRGLMERALGVRRPGCASVDFGWVASGRFDGFFETGLAPWDVAAGIVLVREGGGRVTDYEGRPPTLFGEGIVASNGLIHDELLEALAPLRRVQAGGAEAAAQNPQRLPAKVAPNTAGA